VGEKSQHFLAARTLRDMVVMAPHGITSIPDPHRGMIEAREGLLVVATTPELWKPI
jgi:hypothetical protein